MTELKIQVTLRSGKKEDIPELLRVFEETPEPGGEHYSHGAMRQADVGYLEKVITQEGVICAVESMNIVGFCAYTQGSLSHLYVLPEYQGRGIGSMLLNEVKKRQSFLSLWVFKANEKARDFYLDHGFLQMKPDNEYGTEIEYVWDRKAD